MCIALALIPVDTGDRILMTRCGHPVIKSGRLPVHKIRRRNLFTFRTDAVAPFSLQTDLLRIVKYGIFLAHGEASFTLFTDHPKDKRIFALLKHPLRNLIFTRRILIIRHTDLYAVHICHITVHDRSEPELCTLSRHFLRNGKRPSEPHASDKALQFRICKPKRHRNRIP